VVIGDQRESYDAEFKRKSVEHMEATSKKPIEIARELNIPKSTLSNWIKQYGSGCNQNIVTRICGL
jgi:transposase